MGVRTSMLLAFTAAVSLPLGSAVAQVATGTAVQVQRPTAVPVQVQRPPVVTPVQPQPAPVAGQAQPADATQVAPPPPPLPPPMWDMLSAQDLYYYILQVGRDGLNPEDYEPEGLRLALASRDPVLVSKEANDRFARVSTDLALGHVRRAARTGWYMSDPDLDAAKQDSLLRTALAQHRITDALNGLLPTHPQYAALKAALAMTPATETAKLDRIRLNMDRWRWLPRDLGQKYIIVNVPGFHATLVENGVNRWKHRAIAGALKTPTPQLSAMAVGVMLNPWWEVPPSITKEVAGKKGFVALKDEDGKIKRWRQPPGPTNALGQLKFVMYNPQNIYLHDTNARSRFSSRMRALSHGCIRTEHVLDLATQLLGDDNGEWTPEKIQAQLASGKTKQANFVKPVPVYIVYFSSAALNDGTIVDYNDLYGRDTMALAALEMKDGGVSLAKKDKPKPAAKAADKVASN